MEQFPEYMDSYSSSEDGEDHNHERYKISICRADLKLLRRLKENGTLHDQMQTQGWMKELAVDDMVKDPVSDVMNFLQKKRRAGFHNSDRRWRIYSSDITFPFISFVRENSFTGKLYPADNRGHLNTLVNSALIFYPILTDSKRELKSLYIVAGPEVYQSLYKVSDSEFLTTLPLQIADNSKAVCHNVRSLVGIHHTKISPDHETAQLNSLEVGDVCTHFKAEVSRESIQNFILPHIQNDTKVEFRVTQGKITFHTPQPLSMEQVQFLVRRLEYIFIHKPEFPILHTNKLQKLWFSTSKESGKELTQELSENINEILMKSVQSPEFKNDWYLRNIGIYQPVGKQYLADSSYQMNFKNLHFEFQNCPSLDKIISSLRKVYLKKSTQKPFSFPNVVGKTSIIFPGKYTRIEHSLIQSLRGYIYSQKYDALFWVQYGQWYHISADVELEVRRKFQKILCDSLVPLGNPQIHPVLDVPWGLENNTTLEDEKKYSRKYDKYPNYFVGNEEADNCIVYYDESKTFRFETTTYFCHAKAGFGNSRQNVCSKFNQSIKMLHRLRQGSEDDQNYVSQLANNVFKGNLERCKEVLGIYPAPKNHMVCVLGLHTNTDLVPVKNHMDASVRNSFDERTKYHLLKAEMKLLCVDSEAHISRYISESKGFKQILIKMFGNSNPSAHLITLLQAEGFLKKNLVASEPERLVATVKVLLLEDQPKEKFKDVIRNNSSLTQEDADTFCEHIGIMLQGCATYVGNFGAKLEIIQCKHLFETHIGHKNKSVEFKICEILTKAQ